MTRIHRLSVVLLALSTAGAAEAAQRAYVASTGTDANTA